MDPRSGRQRQPSPHTDAENWDGKQAAESSRAKEYRDSRYDHKRERERSGAGPSQPAYESSRDRQGSATDLITLRDSEAASLQRVPSRSATPAGRQSPGPQAPTSALSRVPLGAKGKPAAGTGRYHPGRAGAGFSRVHVRAPRQPGGATRADLSGLKSERPESSPEHPQARISERPQVQKRFGRDKTSGFAEKGFVLQRKVAAHTAPGQVKKRDDPVRPLTSPVDLPPTSLIPRSGFFRKSRGGSNDATPGGSESSLVGLPSILRSPFRRRKSVKSPPQPRTPEMPGPHQATQVRFKFFTSHRQPGDSSSSSSEWSKNNNPPSRLRSGDSLPYDPQQPSERANSGSLEGRFGPLPASYAPKRSISPSARLPSSEQERLWRESVPMGVQEMIAEEQAHCERHAETERNKERDAKRRAAFDAEQAAERQRELDNLEAERQRELDAFEAAQRLQEQQRAERERLRRERRAEESIQRTTREQELERRRRDSAWERERESERAEERTMALERTKTDDKEAERTRQRAMAIEQARIGERRQLLVEAEKKRDADRTQAAEEQGEKKHQEDLNMIRENQRQRRYQKEIELAREVVEEEARVRKEQEEKEQDELERASTAAKPSSGELPEAVDVGVEERSTSRRQHPRTSSPDADRDRERHGTKTAPATPIAVPRRRHSSRDHPPRHSPEQDRPRRHSPEQDRPRKHSPDNNHAPRRYPETNHAPRHSPGDDSSRSPLTKNRSRRREGS